MSSQPIKVILDTDIGSDIDDAVCLAYLLANPKCDLVGITTVTGEPGLRAAMASAMCNVVGRKIPIHSGTRIPMFGEQRQPLATQAAALTRWPHDATFPSCTAIEFLRQTIRQHPGEIVLLTIGPLTNIALLFALDPEIPGLLKGVVSMAGRFTNLVPTAPVGEWNAILDATATKLVYERPLAYHRSIGLDVTLQVTMPAPEVRERFTAPLLRPVLDFAEIWFKHTQTVTFHDPLAATTLFDDQICKFEKGDVSIEMQDQARLGETIWKPSPTGKHEVAVGVDSKRFFDHYFSYFK